jgi:prevent-host-death family protein
MTQLTISKARSSFLDMPELVRKVPERAIEVTRRGRPVLAVLPWDFYESIVETLDVLSDPELATALRDSIEDLRRGRLVSHEEAGKRLGV